MSIPHLLHKARAATGGNRELDGLIYFRSAENA